MAQWAKDYFLKGDATGADVWGCITESFGRLGVDDLPKDEPAGFFIERGGSSFAWRRVADGGSRKTFTFSGRLKSAEVYVQIDLFDDLVDFGKGGKVRRLGFVEKSIRGEGIVYCAEFFPVLRRLIPRKLADAKIIQYRQAFRNALEQGSAKVDLGPSDIKIMFFPDCGGNFSFPKEWIRRFAEDLHFLGADFVEGCSREAAFEQFCASTMGRTPDYRKASRRQKRDPRLAEKFREAEERGRAALKKEFEGFMPPSVMPHSSIEIDVRESCGKFALDGEAFAGRYEDFRNVILNAVCGRFAADCREERFDLQSQLNLSMNLRSRGLDEDSVGALRAGLDSAVAEAERLRAEGEGKDAEIAGLRERLRNAEAPAPVAAAADSPADDGRIGELEAEIRRKDAEIEGLKARLGESEKSRTGRQNAVNGGVVTLRVPCGEKNLFPDEIEDYLYALLYSALGAERKILPDKEIEYKRKRDVLRSLLDSRTFGWEGSETAKKIGRIETILRGSRDPNYQRLAQEGFSLFSSEGRHQKFQFCDERYWTVFSDSPDTPMWTDNAVPALKKRFFLLPPEK